MTKAKREKNVNGHQVSTNKCPNRKVKTVVAYARHFGGADDGD